MPGSIRLPDPRSVPLPSGRYMNGRETELIRPHASAPSVRFHPEKSFRATGEISFSTEALWTCEPVSDRDEANLWSLRCWSERTAARLQVHLGELKCCCAKFYLWTRTVPIPLYSVPFPYRKKSLDGGGRLLQDWSGRTAAKLRVDAQEPTRCCAQLCW